MPGRLSIAVCENYLPELEAVLAGGKFPGVRACPFGCRCGRAPLSWEDVSSWPGTAAADELHVFGSACLSALARSPSRPAHVRLHRMDICHEFLASRTTVDSFVRRGGYLVTGAWLQAWEERIDGLGSDRAMTCGIIGETCKSVVLLDGDTDVSGRGRLGEFAAAVGLPAEVAHAGVDLLEARVQTMELEHRMENDRARLTATVARSQQHAAEYAMALEVLSDLAAGDSEAGVIDGLFRLFEMLFGAKRLTYSPRTPQGRGTPSHYPPDTKSDVYELAPRESHVLSDTGFTVSIQHGHERVGVLQVDELEHPEHRDHYANLALNLAGVCGLAITNARQREQLIDAERALAAEKERLLTTLRSIGDGVLATDAQGRVALLNGAAERLTGWTEAAARGKPWQQVLRISMEKTGSPEDSLVERVLSSGAEAALANGARLHHIDGSSRLIADSAAPIQGADGHIAGVVVVFRDVTQTERLERELQRVERLESLAVFAGGLAHDFNNLLSAMMGNLSVAQDFAAGEQMLQECLDDALQAGRRATDLTRQLLTFSRGGAPVKSTASLEEIVRESASFAIRGSRTRADIEIADALWPIDADEGQISQVIRNLVLNADQAMPQGGVVRIACSNTEPSDLGGLPLPPGRYVRITVTDDGPGIPLEHHARVFDPFFTTKKKGSGLGLAVAYSVIKRHDGHIAVRSAPGQGASFQVYLPAADTMSTAPSSDHADTVGGTGYVLLMDDDPDVRRSTARTLTHLGYVVEQTSDGDAAIAAYQAALLAGAPFDLVVLDMTVPGAKGGLETLQELLAIDAGVRAIACTGYANASVLADWKSHGFVGAIPKPFDMAEFSHVIRDALHP